MPGGNGTPRPSRKRAASSAATQRSSPAMRARQARRPRTSSSSQSAAGPSVRAATSSVVRSPIVAQQVVDGVDGAGVALRDQPLQLQLEVGERGGVDQVAQLVAAEQLGEQLAVQGQRRGAALGQGCVALVHEARDVVEQQRRGER